MAYLENNPQLQAAIIAGGDAEMDRAANRLVGNIRSEAGKHNLTAAFMNSWKVMTAPGRSGNGRLVDDRLVYSDDDGALAINYGHVSGPRPHQSHKYVPGKHVVEAAIGRTAQ